MNTSPICRTLTAFFVSLTLLSITWPGTAIAEPLRIKKQISSATACYAISKRPYANKKEQTAGMRHCNRAIRFDRLNKKALATTYLNRGVLHKNMGQHKKALGDFYRSLRLNGNAPALSVNIGNVSYAYGDFKKAIREYDKALAMKIDTPEVALLNKGMASERLGEKQKAITAYSNALQHNPGLELAKQRLQQLVNDRELLSMLTAQHDLKV